METNTKDEKKPHQEKRDDRNAKHKQEDVASRDHRRQREGGYKKDGSHPATSEPS